MDPNPSSPPTSTPLPGGKDAATPDRVDPDTPDTVVVTSVTVVTATALPGDPAAATAADASPAPLRPEDVHVRPPDHLPEGVTPEAENVELIFERS